MGGGFIGTGKLTVISLPVHVRAPVQWRRAYGGVSAANADPNKWTHTA